ncbi:hypothetical protein GQF42_16015 [Streptomyces broussonetiae]|uniref:Uncharacterized protein n=1 Tax=Streptomyces broussonetiae TaxID=2686304 RepID=A0A6I6N844_9ACTN|nr:hypothetical protein [Streptomyces broussonetiae]QHA04596.1 hypothetical protein GQF42_16015 [Streptomyces broussonetiae]
MLTAVADALSEHPEELMTLGVLLALTAGEPAVLRHAPAIPEGATRGEYAALLRLTVLEVHP